MAAMTPEQLVSRHHGKGEEAAVTPAQHHSILVGKSWTRETGEPPLNEHDLPEATQVPWLGQKVEHPEGYGSYSNSDGMKRFKVILSFFTSMTGMSGRPASTLPPATPPRISCDATTYIFSSTNTMRSSIARFSR